MHDQISLEGRDRLVGFALCLLRVYDAHDDAIAGVLHVLDVQLLLHRFHGDVGLRREGQERQTPEEQRPHGSDLMADPLRSKFAPLGWTASQMEPQLRVQWYA